MKVSVIALLVFGSFLLAGCASWQGQVAYPNTRFAALPKLEPAAIPKDAEGNISIQNGISAVTTSPGKGAFVPILGQVAFGSSAVNLKFKNRDFFYWQDPSEFVTSSPTFTLGTWDNAVTGVMSQGSAELSTSVGVKLSAGDKGIPLGGGKAITLKLGVDGSLKLSNVRVARLNLANLDYVRALADAASDQEAYFVGEVLVCDVNSANLVGFDLAYADPANLTFNPTLRADYDAKYSGVGLVLGASYNKLSVAGNVSFKELGSKDKSIHIDTLTAIGASSKNLQDKVNILTKNLRSLGVDNPDIVLQSPFTTIKDSTGNVIVTPVNPFMGGIEILVVDKKQKTDGKVTLSDVGEHQFQYSVVAGNKLYALRTIVVLKKSANGKIIEESVVNRDVSYLKWEAVNLLSAN